MGTPRTLTTRRTPWPSIDALKREVLARCEEKFLETFRRPWDPACKAGLIAEQRHAFPQDQKARKLWEEVRRVMRKVNAFLEDEGLGARGDLMRLPGNSPRTVGLALWVDECGSCVDSAADDEWGMPAYPETLRSLVAQRWEYVDPRFLPYQSSPPPAAASSAQVPEMIWGSGSRSQTQQLSDSELAVVSILCGSWPKINESDLKNGITVGKVIDRERVNIKHARKHQSGPM